MKITDLRATTVTMPLEAPLRHSNGAHWGRFVRTIVEIETDEGLTGVGEMGGGGQSAEAAIAGLKPYLRALWAISPPVVETPGDAPEAMRRRAGFGGGGIRLPPSYAGFPASDQKQLHRATLAHIGAHHCFTREKFPAKGLKPLQLALVSLIEDARVERLAMREMPGLFALWRDFHVARPEGAPVAITLMARLAQRCVDEGLPRMAWWVLNWNEPSRVFYRSIGAKAQDEWTVKRLEGEALARLGAEG